MTDKTGNHKIHPPKLAISRSMIDAGKKRLDALVGADTEDAQITDDLLVAEVFLSMWDQYWTEVMEVQRRKDEPSNILLMPTKLITPNRGH